MTAKKIVTGIGFILVLIAIVKLSIIGYYPREAPLYIGISISGIVFLLLGKVLPSNES